VIVQDTEGSTAGIQAPSPGYVDVNTNKMDMELANNWGYDTFA